MKSVLIGFACLIGILLLGFGLQYWDLVNFGFFAPKYEDVRYKTFTNTQSYVQGKIRDLSNYKEQYELAKDSADKVSIKETIKQQFASFDSSKLPDGLQSFLFNIRGY